MADEQQAQMQIANGNLLIPFSDMAIIRQSENGVFFDFMQTNGTNQVPIISRVGMSHEHARRFLAALQQNLNRAPSDPAVQQQTSTSQQIGFVAEDAR